MAAQGRGSSSSGNRSGGGKPGNKSGAGKAGAKAQAKSKQAAGRAGPSSAQRRQAASKAVAKARGGGSNSNRLLWTLVPVAVVVVVVIAFVAVKMAQSSKPKSGQAAGLASTQVVHDIENVPASTSAAVGAGDATPPAKLGTTVVKSNGLPRVLYIGADYCPYCAAERWGLAIAMSRFGKFSLLGTTASSPTDVYPNTQTLSFHGAKFTSSTIVFDAYEMKGNQPQGNGYAPLDTVPEADQKLLQSQGQGSFPFVNIAGLYLIKGASYDPGVLKGLSREQIAADLSDPSSPVAKGAVGSANLITAAICKATNNQPSDVCTDPGVVAAAKKL